MERPSPERSIIHIGCIEYRVYVAQALLLPLPGRPSHAKSSCGCAAPATNEIPVEPCISPSPGTPGEGRGEGLFLVHGRALTLTISRSTGRGNQRISEQEAKHDAQQMSDERRRSSSLVPAGVAALRPPNATARRDGAGDRSPRDRAISRAGCML